MTGALPIQLAIQGGGAKLVQLLAALDAFYTAEQDGRIYVTRLAGTSAGAIAACLYAAGVSPAIVRDRIKADGLSLARSALPSRTLLWSMFRLATGRAVYDERRLRDLLKHVFEDTLGIRTLGELHRKTNRQVLIVTADLNNRTSVARSSDGDSLVDALLDSCALPFLFRTRNRFVDGGIVENLPSEQLTARTDRGPVIAIGFMKSVGSDPATVIDFGNALLETVVWHSVSASSKRLGSNIFLMKPRYRTTDFERAITDGTDEPWAWDRESARRFLESLESRLRGPRDARDPWEAENEQIKVRVGDVYFTNHHRERLDFTSVSVIVHAQSLRKGKESELDAVYYQMRFRPAPVPIHAHSIQFRVCDAHSSDDNQLSAASGGRSWELIEESAGAVVPTVDIPAYNPESPGARELVLFFLPPIPAAIENDNRLYRLKFQDNATDSLSGLRQTNGSDFVRVRIRRAAQKVGEINLIAWLPNEPPYTQVRVESVQVDGKSSAEFEPIPPAVLAREYPAPIGHRGLGILLREAPHDSIVQMNLTRRKPS